MKKILLLLSCLISTSSFAAMNTFTSNTPIKATDLNQNFSHVHDLFLTKYKDISFSSFSANEVISKSKIENNLEKIRQLGFSISSIPSTTIKATELNLLFNQIVTAFNNYNYPSSCSSALDRDPTLLNSGVKNLTLNKTATASSFTCDFVDNKSYVRVLSWDNTSSVIQRGSSAMAQAAYENKLFIKGTFSGINPSTQGYNPGMGNPANLDIVGIYSLNNPRVNLIANKARLYVFSSGSNGAFTAGGRGYLFFVRTPSYTRNAFSIDFPNVGGPADNNLNGVLDNGENGDLGQIILFANGRVVWLTSLSNGVAGSGDPSSYIYTRNLDNATYWMID